ncbi:MAG: hypothetical protein ACKO85_05775 [Isosphaeraceae bacterium]
MPDSKVDVAAVITQWTTNSHADVILTRICEPAVWGHQKPFDVRIKRLYVDYFAEKDLARDMAAKHGIELCDSITEAVSGRNGRLDIRGVIAIGEHGPYARNSKGQQLYPRRRFLDEIAESFRRAGQVVPVFTDKHFSYEPIFSQWIIQTYKHMHIPLMAGSSLPVGWRYPEQSLTLGTGLRRAYAQGYSDLDAYGFHTLETLQCQVERRRGGETGVKSVRAVARGESAWEAPEFPKDLWQKFFDQYKNRPQHRKLPGYRKTDELWEISYTDGLIAHMGILTSEGEVWGVALEDEAKAIQATVFELEDRRPFGHFGYLTRAIESMMKTGKPPYPVERTYLTTGILAALLQSRSEGGREVPTPFLSNVRYQPAEWPFATGSLGNPA